MKKMLLGALLAGTGCFGSLLSDSASAGWPEFKHSMHIDRARNNVWPQPFRAMDSRAVVAPFEIMRNNGWRSFNTLGDSLFTDANMLSDAGEIQVFNILTKVPEGRRVIFVYRGRDNQTTDKRVEQVQLAVSRMLPVGELPPIYVTNIPSEFTSGERQTILNRAMRTIPAPTLPAFGTLNAPPQVQMTGGGNP